MTTALCIVFILLVPAALAGISLINTGLGRSRSAAHSMMAALCVTAVAALAYFVCGFAWQGFPGGPACVLTVAGKEWNWSGAGPFFLRHFELDASPAALAVLLGMFSVSLAALIPLGAGGDRWRLGASCASTALLAGWTYPIFAHWAWGGGWLAQLGFVDAGGSGAIHAVGGLTALSIAWIVGPRRGKYAPDGMPAAIPGHNTVIVLFGCMLALLGWIGLNAAGAILYTGAPTERIALIGVNPLLAAGSAALSAAAITRFRFGRPDASLCANGWVAGLVSSSAACAVVQPAIAVIIGLVAGALIPIAVEWLELHLSVDDPGGVISVHTVGGVWGLLAAGHWLPQLVGIATLLGCMLPMTYAVNWIVNRIYPQRVASEGERNGMDLFELGAGAYPEFLTHNEDFTQR